MSLDPNIRPGFIKDAPAHRARIDRMIALADIVKVSDEDLAWITNDSDPDATVQSWLANGCSVVTITRGAEGASLYTGRDEINVPAVKMPVVDTVGAGDTFNAGFLGGLQRQGLLTKSALAAATREQLLEAGNLAARVAALTVSKAGADAPWRGEVGL